MTRYVFVGHSSPVEGREDEYNDWYLQQHLPAMMQCVGVLSVRRFKCADAQLPNAATPYRYLAIYEIETDAAKSFVKDMLERAISGRLPASSSNAPGSSGVLWELE
jgi:hypothetical protein